MAIKQLINTRSPGEMRLFQTRMIQLGRIRTGVFATPPGKRGRPEKLDRFRFTSLDRDLIQAVCEEYGGTVEEYVPQGVGKRGWQVTTDADRIPVYIVNGQKIDPTYEAWAGGGRCVRRCDGEWDAARGRACLCNGLDRDDYTGAPIDPPAPRDMCKPTTRVNLMLPAIEGIGSWMYESHGENFAIENGGVLAQFVASAPVAVPAWFCLEPETRQHRKADGSFEKRDFYVARFRISAITPEQIALGGDVVSRILTQAGAPAALAAPVSAVPAIEAAPAESRPPRGPAFDGRDLDGPAAPTPRGTYSGPAVEPSADLVAKILRDIEAQTDLDGLEAIKAKLKTRGINPPQAVKDAWASKAKAVALVQLNEMAEADPDGFADAVNALPPDDREELGRRLADAEQRQADPGYDPTAGPCLDPYCAGGPAPCGFTPDEHMQAHGPAAIIEADRAAGRIPEREYAVGDTVTVGGIEFTKISNNPFPPGTPAAQLFAQAEAEIEAEEVGDDLPQVPDGDYPIPREMAMIMTMAGQRTPPWTLDQVTAAIVAAFGLKHIAEVTGHQLARFRTAMERGLFDA